MSKSFKEFSKLPAIDVNDESEGFVFFNFKEDIEAPRRPSPTKKRFNFGWTPKKKEPISLLPKQNWVFFEEFT